MVAELETALAASDVWAHETFPASTDGAKISHLREEFDELLATPRSGEEMADVLMILSHLFGHDEIAVLVEAIQARSYWQVARQVESKLAICRKRKWGTPDETGKVKALKHTVQEYRAGWMVLDPLNYVVSDPFPTEEEARQHARSLDALA